MQDNVARIIILFVSLDNTLYSFSPTKRCSNNITEYEAVIVGLGLAMQTPVPNQPDHLRQLRTDSQTTRREYSIKKAKLIPHQKRAEKLLAQLEEVKTQHVYRVNKFFDRAN